MSGVYLVTCAVVFTMGYGLPLAIAPLTWARRFGWEVHDNPLTIYFGRCLGCVILCVSAVTVHAALQPSGRPLVLELLALAFGAMAIVHLLGWLRRTQPVLETVELPFFILLTVAALWLGGCDVHAH